MLNKLTQSVTLADRAYKEMKQAILKGEFKPGDPLPEETIASMLGISRTPLRKAITRLAFEGLVDLESGKIARVASYTEQDLVNFIKLRAVLEVFSSEQAVPFVTDSHLSMLEELVREQRAAFENNDFYSYIELDAKFHVMIAEITQNQKLKEFIEQINNQLHRYLILSGTLENSAMKALQEHEEIIEAFRARDVSNAGATMRRHIQNVEKRAKKESDNIT